jgi:L-alanine-DL-glutamate epimerase-like enolase superfamily enzyme
VQGPYTVKITRAKVFVPGDSKPAEPVDYYLAERALLRIHTDAGLTGLSEIFSVPGVVAKAVLDGPDSLLGRALPIALRKERQRTGATHYVVAHRVSHHRFSTRFARMSYIASTAAE